MSAALPLILAASTLALGFLPSLWLWRARAASPRDWFLTLATAGSVVTFAYAAGPWLFVSHYLRYIALVTYLAVALASVRRRRKLLPTATAQGSRLGFLLRAGGLVTALTLDLLALAAGIAPEGAIDVAFPLTHGTYGVLQGGNSVITNPFHRTNPGERFALDLVRLNTYGARATSLAPALLRAYAVFDEPVVSPCDGTVLQALDGVADNVPGRANVTAPAGNHVVLRCNGTDLLLAHLGKGSITVRPTQRVVPGQQVGRVGNSGNTGEPHLHLSASRGGLPVPLTFGSRFLSLNSIYTASGTRTERP